MFLISQINYLYRICILYHILFYFLLSPIFRIFYNIYLLILVDYFYQKEKSFIKWGKMERIELELINEICENQNFDELLLKIVHKSNSKNRINNLLNEIENNKTITIQLKMKIYEEIFEYVSDVNDYLKNNLKEIFLIASEKIIAEINNNLGGNVDMLEKIRVIIAEDNIHICKFIEENLKKHNDIEILGIANTDEEEIKMIEEQKPEIVITDLMRNNKYSGLDIIKNYYNNNSQVEFLVISADYKEDVINDGLEVAGYIKKPFKDYEIIYNELKRIKKI